MDFNLDLNDPIEPDDKVGLELTREERELLLTGLVFLYEHVEKAIRVTPPGAEVRLTWNDLDFLAGHVAGGANHAKTKKIERILGGLYDKIDALLTYGYLPE
jgi:hypothetical protein